MSNATPLMVGLAGGLVIWHLAPSARPAAPIERPPGPAAPIERPGVRDASSGTCALQLDRSGLAIYGEPVEVNEAVRRAQLVGLALVTVAPDASASLYAALMTGLRRADVPTHTQRRIVAMRNANTETFSAFTLVTYPEGVGGSRKNVHWFRTDTPMTWQATRDQLAAANVIDPSALSPKQAGYWKLVTDPRVFRPRRAEPLPTSASTQRRGAARQQRYVLDGGRVIVRDGQPLVRLERVDLGDSRYVLSPYETDELGARLVRLLNRGAR